MFCVSIAYSNQEGGKFDFAYYTKQHIPMVTRFLGSNAIRSEVRKGVSAPDGSAAAFICLANFWVKSVEEFQATLAKHGAEIMGDVPNYTNLQPILQVDEVLA